MAFKTSDMGRESQLKKALIIGYGSIGKRHDEVLLQSGLFQEIHLVTKQDIAGRKTFANLENVPDLESYQYFIIASETYKHLDQLEYLNSHLTNKIIFCEKPLFEKSYKISNIKNSVFVGYVLRFHPLIAQLKKLIADEILYSANIVCGQYLPTWRSRDYKQSYSASKKNGGGVSLDLSHEIDYALWMFGKFFNVSSIQKKISDLEIDSDDIMTLIAQTKQGAVINISLDYISKFAQRKIIVHTNLHSYEVDLINNILTKVDKNQKKEIAQLPDLKRNDMFFDMHKSILQNQNIACDLKQGLEVMEIIDLIQKQN